MKTVLLTGATSGIGLELARLYAQDVRLLLIGRKPLPELDTSLFTPKTYCQVDLAHKEAPDKIISFLSSEAVDKLDVVIHNAAIGYYGSAVSQSLEESDTLLQVNLYTPVTLTHALQSYLQPNSKLIFISSIAASLPAPNYALYSASKAALSSFARQLRLETPLTVQTIYPGAIRTNMHQKSGVPEGTFDTSKFPSASEVALQIRQTLEGPRAETTLGFGNTLARWFGRKVPDLLDAVSRRNL